MLPESAKKLLGLDVVNVAKAATGEVVQDIMEDFKLCKDFFHC